MIYHLFAYVSMISIFFMVIHFIGPAAAQSNNTEKENMSQLSANISKDEPILVEDTNSSLIAVLGVIAIIATLAIYFYQDKSEKKQIRDTSSRALKRELKDNGDALSSEKTPRIKYKLNKGTDPPKEVNYANYYLDYEAYNSLISSGSFMYLPGDIQNKLTMLYGRIKRHNELLTYLDHLEDTFFATGDSKENYERYLPRASRYDLALTKLESEITRRIEELNKDFGKRSKK